MDKYTEINWLMDSVCSNLNHLNGIRTRENPIFSCFPQLIKQGYFSEIPNVLLSDVANQKALASCPEWLVRDGVSPITELLPVLLKKRQPTKIIFDASLRSHFTPSQRKHFQFFQIQPDIWFDGRKKPKSILISLVANELVSTAELLEEKLSQMVKVFGTVSLKSMKIMVYLDRFDGPQHPYADRLVLAFGATLSKYFGSRYEVLNADDVSIFSPLNGTCFCEVNTGAFIADSYMRHHLLSRGAGMISEPTPPNLRARRFIRLSPFHGLDIRS